MLGDGNVERLSLKGVLHCAVHGRLSDANGLSGNTDSTTIKGIHSDLEAKTRLSDQIFFWNETIFVDKARSGASTNSKLIFFLSERETFRIIWNNKAGYTLKH